MCCVEWQHGYDSAWRSKLTGFSVVWIQYSVCHRCIHMCVHVCTHVHVYVYVRMCACVCACVCASMHTCAFMGRPKDSTCNLLQLLSSLFSKTSFLTASELTYSAGPVGQPETGVLLSLPPEGWDYKHALWCLGF